MVPNCPFSHPFSFCMAFHGMNKHLSDKQVSQSTTPTDRHPGSQQ